MSDEATQAPSVDTPDPAGLTAAQRVYARWGFPLPPLAGGSEEDGAETPPAETPGSEVNWQERYSSLQPEYTRASQEAAQYRSLIESARQGDPDAIAQLGFEIADDGELDDTPPDPSAELVARLERIEQAEQQRQSQAQEQQMLATAEAHIGRELDAIDGLDAADREVVIDRALRLPPNADNLPDIATAHAEFVAWDTARQARLKQARKRPPAPPSGGQEGTEAPDWSTMTENQINQYMAERARASAE